MAVSCLRFSMAVATDIEEGFTCSQILLHFFVGTIIVITLLYFSQPVKPVRACYTSINLSVKEGFSSDNNNYSFFFLSLLAHSPTDCSILLLRIHHSVSLSLFVSLSSTHTKASVWMHEEAKNTACPLFFSLYLFSYLTPWFWFRCTTWQQGQRWGGRARKCMREYFVFGSRALRRFSFLATSLSLSLSLQFSISSMQSPWVQIFFSPSLVHTHTHTHAPE